MQMYGNRQIAYVREDREQLTKTFGAYTTQLITATISAAIYLLFVFNFIENIE